MVLKVAAAALQSTQSNDFAILLVLVAGITPALLRYFWQSQIVRLGPPSLEAPPVVLPIPTLRPKLLPHHSLPISEACVQPQSPKGVDSGLNGNWRQPMAMWQ